MSYVKTVINRSIFVDSQYLRGIITKKRLLWHLRPPLYDSGAGISVRNVPVLATH